MCIFSPSRLLGLPLASGNSSVPLLDGKDYVAFDLEWTDNGDNGTGNNRTIYAAAVLSYMVNLISSLQSLCIVLIKNMSNSGGSGYWTVRDFKDDTVPPLTILPLVQNRPASTASSLPLLCITDILIISCIYSYNDTVI
jgi:hypothetical protein